MKTRNSSQMAFAVCFCSVFAFSSLFPLEAHARCHWNNGSRVVRRDLSYDEIWARDRERQRKHELELAQREAENAERERQAAERSRQNATKAEDSRAFSELDGRFSATMLRWTALSRELADESYAGMIDNAGTNVLRSASMSAQAAKKARLDCQEAVAGHVTGEYRAQALESFRPLTAAFEDQVELVEGFKRDLDSMPRRVSSRTESGSSPNRRGDDSGSPEKPGGSSAPSNARYKQFDVVSAVLLKPAGPVGYKWICRDAQSPENVFVVDFADYNEKKSGKLRVGSRVKGVYLVVNGKTETVDFNDDYVSLPLVRWMP